MSSSEQTSVSVSTVISVVVDSPRLHHPASPPPYYYNMRFRSPLSWPKRIARSQQKRCDLKTTSCSSRLSSSHPLSLNNLGLFLFRRWCHFLRLNFLFPVSPLCLVPSPTRILRSRLHCLSTFPLADLALTQVRYYPVNFFLGLVSLSLVDDS